MYQDRIFNELIIDNFAGGGGASVGIELATGRPVDIAINHDPDAIAMHSVNHPYTTHYQEDVFAIDPEKVTCGRPVGIAWFSPDCKHFSRAKGNKPVEHKIRGLSWVIIKWAMSGVAPRCIFMENVEEIQTWGPLLQDADGKFRPDPARSGETFKAFIGMLSDGVATDCPALIEACEFLKIGGRKMKQIDFFGDEHDIVIDKKIKRKKYRTMQEIYGIIPEKTCKTCAHCIGKRRNIRAYYKCDLWFDTHCDATDIRLKNQACKCYVEESEK